MAKRDELLDNIRRKLSTFMVEVGMNNRVNRQNINISGEDIGCGLLNLIFDWELKNINAQVQNYPGIDLADWEEGVGIQVTSDTTSAKIKKTLDKICTYDLTDRMNKLIVLLLKEKPDYTTMFPHDGFELEILDLYDLSKLMEGMSVKKLGQIFAYLDEELGSLFDSPTEPKLRYMLPPVPQPSSAFVPGSRDRELAELKAMLSPDKPVFLWGVGGIGKTEVAYQLAKRFAPAEGAYFLHYYDMPGEGEALRETILRAEFTDYRFQGQDNENRDHEYRERMNILKKEYPGALLVIDNFDRPGRTLADMQNEDTYKELVDMGIRLVFTTRRQVKNGYEIKPMAEEYLLKLMQENLEGVEASDDELRSLIKAVDGHTLMVMLMARTLAESWGDVTPKVMLEAMQSSTLNQADFPEVVNDQNRNYKQQQIYAHMKTLFDLSGLNEADQSLLRFATLIPEDGMNDRLFKGGLSRTQQQVLRDLISRGWLHRESGILTIHPAIREVCLHELIPTDENCGDFLDSLHSQTDLAKTYDTVSFRQLAKCFSVATEKLKDARGKWATLAGWLWSKVGQHQIALRYELQIVQRLKELLPADHLDLAKAYNSVGITYSRLGRNNEALEYVVNAFEMRKACLEPDDLELARSYNNVGHVYGELGEYAKALEYRLHAMRIREKKLKNDDIHLSISYNDVGITYDQLGNFRIALEFKDKARIIREKVLPKNHPNIASIYESLGNTYSALGDSRTAFMYHERALNIREEVLPKNHPNLAFSYDNMGTTLCETDRLEEGLKFQKKSLSIREEILPPNHPDLATSFNNIGYTYGRIGKRNGTYDDYVTAVQYLEKALEIRKHVLTDKHPQIALTYGNLEWVKLMMETKEQTVCEI